MVLDLRQRAGTPSGSEVTEVTSAVAEPKKGGGRRARWWLEKGEASITITQSLKGRLCCL